MTALTSILPLFAMGALASHCDQRQQQRRINNTTTVLRLSLGSVTPDECTICEHFESQHRRMTKEAPKARATWYRTRSAVDHIRSIAPSSLPINDTPARKVTQLGSNSAITAELACKLCGMILDQPIQLTECNNLVCMNCLCTALEERAYFVLAAVVTT